VADLSDEVLMAYADGQLSPAERVSVEASIREHPHYQRKVEQFRATREPIRQAFDAELDGSRLAALAARIRQAPASSPRGRAGLGIVPARSQASSVASFASWPTALAASLALLVGGGLGWLMHRPAEREQTTLADLMTFRDGLRADGALAELLETASSGSTLRVRDVHGRAWQLKAVSTFRSTADRPCRQYELTDDVAARLTGYACRDTNAQWLIQAHARLDRRASANDQFSPAGDGDGPLDAAIRAHMKGDLLQSSEERQWIESHWSEDRGK
jgi:anti-sigma factor RsiW